MTHDDLVKRAEKWLLNTMGCSFCLTELTTVAGEIPDAIGWKDGKSILVECKATRADFLSDKKKIFRRKPEIGMGTYRFYMCPPGLIRECEIPEKWGLLYCHEKTIKKVVAPKGNSFYNFPSFTANKKNETIMLCSVIRRVHLRGDLEKIYTMEY
jgi:hypothetical protein